MTVGIYCRISVDKSGRREGVEAQEAWGREYATRLWPGDPVRIFADNSLSAAKNNRRPGFEKLKAAVRRGEIQQVWVRDQARLERRYEWFPLAVELIAAGIDEIHTKRGIVQLDDIGTDVQAVFNARYAREVTKNAIDKHEWIASLGRPNGGQVFGYRHGKDGQGRKSLLIVPKEAEAVRWAADAVLSGWSLTNVAVELGKRGHVGRRGAPFGPSRVRVLLGNPTVAGLRSHRGTLTKGCWEPILEQQTWQQLRTRLASPRTVIRRTDGKKHYVGPATLAKRPGRRYLLTGGLARCGVCGAAMVGGMHRRSARGQRPAYSLPYLMCPPVIRGGKGCVSVVLNPLEEMVVGMLLNELDTPEFRAALSSDEHSERRAQLCRDLEEIDEQRAALALMWTRKELNMTEWATARGGLDEREQELRAEQGALPPAPDNEPDDDLEARWFDDMTLDQKRAELRKRVREVVVYSAKKGARSFDEERVAVRSILDQPVFDDSEPDDYRSNILTDDNIFGLEVNN